MKVEITDLKTIKNFALKHSITPSYVYKLIKESKMQGVTIDGVQFIDTKKFPSLPNQPPLLTEESINVTKK